MTLRYLPRKGDVITCLADHPMFEVVKDWEEGIMRSFWVRYADGTEVAANSPIPTMCQHPGCKYPFRTGSILAFHVREHGWTSFEPQWAIPDCEAWDAGVQAHEERKRKKAEAAEEKVN